MTKETAAKWSLKSIVDLVLHQGEVTVAAPPEFGTRAQGLAGLKTQYNLVPKDFRPLKGKAIVDALIGGQAQAANIFSTDPSIAANGFVTLEDPKLLFGSDNIVPLVRKDKVNDTLTAALNAVSAKLDTSRSPTWSSRSTSAKQDASAVAKDFLTKNAPAERPPSPSGEHPAYLGNRERMPGPPTRACFNRACAGYCTSTSTSSWPLSRFSATRASRVGRWSWAVGGTRRSGLWCRPPPTRRERSASGRGCRCALPPAS